MYIYTHFDAYIHKHFTSCYEKVYIYVCIYTYIFTHCLTEKSQTPI